MSYRKNEDGSYTAFRYMNFDGSMLEATAADLDTAKHLLKEEVKAWKSYSLVEANKLVYSPGSENGKVAILANDKIAEMINQELEKGN